MSLEVMVYPLELLNGRQAGEIFFTKDEGKYF